MLTTVSVFALAATLTAPAEPVGPTPGTGGTITVHRSNQMVAPEGFVFEPSGLVGFDTPAPTGANEYNRQVHEIEYYWDFGDPGATFAKLVNVLPWQKDANTAKGPVVSKVYQHGNYVVTCFVYEPASGKNTTLTLNIGGASANTPAVQDPNVVFAGSKTFFVDPDGIYTGAPAGAVGYSSLLTALNATKAIAEQRRVMLRAGKTFVMNNHVIRQDEGPRTGLYVCGEPTGALPVIESLDSGIATFYFQTLYHDNTFDATISRVKGVGNWNEETEVNAGDTKSFVQQLTGGTNNGTTPPATAHPDYFLTYDCDIGGFYNQLTQSVSPRTQKAHIVYDNVFRSWLNIVTLVENKTPTAYRGNLMARSPNAMMGQAKFDGNAHGCIRMQYSGPFDMSRNDLMNNAGWVQNTFGYATQQACARILQSGFYVTACNIEGNSAEGGYQVITLSRQDDFVNSHLQNLVVDSNIIVGSYMSTAAFQLDYGGATFRNNLFIMPDLPLFGVVFSPDGFLFCKPAATLSDAADADQATIDANRAAPINAYNNTIVLLSQDDKFFTGVGIPPVIYTKNDDIFTNKSEANNVIHAPNLSTPVNAGPLDTTPIWTPRILGPRGVYEHRDVVIAVSVAPGATLVIPYASGRVAADYTANTTGKTSPHTLRTAQGDAKMPATLGVTFGATEITLTNNTASTWTAQTAKLILNALPNPTPRLSAYDTPTNTVATYRPLAGSSAFQTATTGQVSYKDALGTVRTAPKSKGWLEPA